MNARYYDPEMGRFLSEDPVGLSGGDLTLYSYAGNNPVVFVDPSGLCASGYSEKIGRYLDYTAKGLDFVSEVSGGVSKSMAIFGTGTAIISTAAEPFTLGTSTLGEGVAGGAYAISGVTGGISVTTNLLSKAISGDNSGFLRSAIVAAGSLALQRVGGVSEVTQTSVEGIYDAIFEPFTK